MATKAQQFIRNLFRGVNQSFGRHQLADGEVWNMLNFRPNRGKLTATFPIYDYFTLTNLIDEVSQSPIKLMEVIQNLNEQLRYLIINHKTARFVDPSNTSVQVQIPVVVQIAKPNNDGVTGECLLYGINVTDFAATNDEIEVEIQTATTFRWRRNAGAWTSGLTIGPEVALGINGLKVSFQDDDGYTVGDVWKWKRSWTHPYTGADSTTDKFPFSVDFYNKDTYIGGIERNVMRVRDDFLTSVGYTRVYGKYVSVFQNHLFVGQYAAGVYDGVLGIKDGYVRSRTPFVIGWSHLNNPDQFFSTDLNEADEFMFPQQAAGDLSNLGITGQGELNDRFFVYFPTSIKVGTYVGLPTVMQWNTAHPRIGNLFPAGLVKAAKGHYFIAWDDVYFFNGIELKAIGQKAIAKFHNEIVGITDSRFVLTRGSYNEVAGEVVFTYWMSLGGGNYQARQMIYQEKFDEWYFRNLPSATSGATDINVDCKYVSGGIRRAFGGNGVVYQDLSANGTAKFDEGTGTYTKPFIETIMRDYGFRRAMKEASGMLVDYKSTDGHALEVAVASGNTFAELGDYVVIGNYNPNTHQVGKWLTFPKVNGRVLSFRFRINNSTVVVNANLFGYEEFIYGANESTEK
jgi:hypothetical protein